MGEHHESPRVVDVAVVGGGIAGLTAAAFAARAGASVRLLDARHEIGGRARTAKTNGFSFNEGPHALYRATTGHAALQELGIRPKGGNPPFDRTRFGLDGRQLRVPPAKAVSQVWGLFSRLGRDRHDPGLVRISAREWIDGRVADPVGRDLAAALVRVSTYSAALDGLSADAASGQLHAALRGVTYLHGGWAQIVAALTAVATGAGATIGTPTKTTSVVPDGRRWTVTGADGSTVDAGAVVLAAGGPDEAAQLTNESLTLSAAAAAARPVHAACFDLGLRRLTRPSVRFILGLDEPTYASIHTPRARLTDDRRHHVVHLMRYEPSSDVGVSELETLADRLQPGWRNEELARQIGRRRVVAFDRPRPGPGLRGRPTIEAAGLTGLFVAGDWVGPDDMLGGAAITSGRASGLAAARHAGSLPRRQPQTAGA